MYFGTDRSEVHPCPDLTKEDAMNKHANPTALERRVVSVLAGNGNLPSVAELQDLIRDTEAERTRSLEAAEADRIKALDVVACPDPTETNERIAAAKLSAERLSASLPRLKAKMEEAISAEATDKWWSDHKRIKEKLDAAVTRFQQYRIHAQAIADLLAEDAALKKEISDHNSAAPLGVDRRLRSSELTARGMTGFTRDNPSLASVVVLPLWGHSAKTLWPQRSPTAMAAEFSFSMVPAPSAGWRWGEPEAVAARRAQAEKENAQMADYHQTAQKNEDDRINAAERERFRQAHPRV
jgi:hypothetical protein